MVILIENVGLHVHEGHRWIPHFFDLENLPQDASDTVRIQDQNESNVDHPQASLKLLCEIRIADYPTDSENSNKFQNFENLGNVEVK